MSLYDILDDTSSSAQQMENARLRQKYTRWAWRSFLLFLPFVITPSLIMYFYSPSQVNEFSPIEAHVLVFGMFAIAGIGLLALIIFLFLRYFLPK
jgi:polyferredoxin